MSLTSPPMINPKWTRNHLPSSQVDPQKKHLPKKPPKLDAEKKNSNLKRTWISCMSDSSLNVAWQLHHVPSHKRIQLSFVWKQHLVSTDTIWWTPTGVFANDDHPLADDVEKQLNVAFAMMKAAHCCFGCRSPTGEFADAHCWWQMPTGWWRCPLADEEAHWLLRWCCRDFQSDNHLSISLTVSPLCQLKGETIFSKIYLNSPPSGVGEFHCRTPSFNCMRVPSSIHCWLHDVWM